MNILVLRFIKQIFIDNSVFLVTRKRVISTCLELELDLKGGSFLKIRFKHCIRRKSLGHRPWYWSCLVVTSSVLVLVSVFHIRSYPWSCKREHSLGLRLAILQDKYQDCKTKTYFGHYYPQVGNVA